jgi:hypothetical protein
MLRGTTATIIRRFPQLVREAYGDKITESGFEGEAWSALRILRVVQMESVDNDEVDTAGETSTGIANSISESLGATKLRIGAHRNSDCRRLCNCRQHLELGWLALRLGKNSTSLSSKGSIPVLDSPNSVFSGPFFLSPRREHLVNLEFESVSKRAENVEHPGPVPKIVIELDNPRLSLERDIEAKEIIIVEDDDD